VTTEQAPSAAQITWQIFQSAEKLLAFSVGLVSVAYLVGWQYSKNYWQSLHSTWVLDLLSPTQMLADASKLIMPMVFAGLLSILGMLKGVRERTTARWFGGLAIFGWSIWAIDLLPTSIAYGEKLRGLLTLTPILLMSSEGVGLSILIFRFRRSNMKWNDLITNHVIWLFVITFFTVPRIAAEFSAGNDTRAETSKLEAVTWPEQPDGDWRLARAVEKGFVVVKLTLDPQITEVRLLPYAATVLIRPINQPIM
jgi:hypothetical protein